MSEKSLEDQIDEVLDELIGPGNALSGTGILGSFLPRLDVSRPNIHDSKKEFLKEKNTVEAVVNSLEITFKQLLGEKDDAAHSDMVFRLRAVVDAGGMKRLRGKSTESGSELALKNILETGFYYNFLFVVLEGLSVYKERLKELKEQEVEFWTVSNRPPNYYARTIAVRLARLYAKAKRQKPTFGISREGNYPSTEFGRSLEQIFLILGIKASVKNAAVWAIDQLTEDDWSPGYNALAMGSLLGAPNPNPSRTTRNALLEALEKRSLD